MLAIPVWFIAQLLISLLLGIIVARILKKFTRVLITRFMPLNQRMASNFFPRLSRISTIVGLFITLAVAIPAYIGIGKTSHWFQVTEKESILATPNTMKQSTQEEINTSSTPLPVTQIPTDYESPEPRPNPKTTNPRSNLTSKESAPPARVTDIYYLQVNAFHQLNKAIQQKTRRQKQTSIAVHIAFLEKDLPPYKVVIGPFPSMEAARKFRKRKKLNGFPRSITPDLIL